MDISNDGTYCSTDVPHLISKRLCWLILLDLLVNCEPNSRRAPLEATVGCLMTEPG